MTAIIIIASGMFLLTVFFTLSEMAFVSANRLIVYIRSKRKRSYLSLFKILEKPEYFLYTVLVGTNLSIVILTTLIEMRIWRSGGLRDSFIHSMAISLVILIFAELLPKSISSKNAEVYGVVFTPAIRFFHTILWPFIFLSSITTELLMKPLGLKKKGVVLPHLTKTDLKHLLTGSVDRKETTVQESKLIDGIFKFGDKQVSDVLIPRTEVISVEENFTFSQLKDMINENDKMFTRMPVYRENEDNIVGVMNINDHIVNRAKKAGEIMVQALFVPETSRLNSVLLMMKKENVHLAVVADEYGGFSGIITIEDIIEELTGDIEDESDIVEDEEDSGSLVIDGDIPIDELAEKYNIILTHSPSYDTAAGYFLSRTGKMPAEGDEVKVSDKISLKVQKMKERRIMEIEIKRKDADEKD